MFGDLGKIMKIAGEMKKNLPKMKEKLAATSYTAQSGDGMVSATVNGKLQLTDLKISQQLIEDCPPDLDILEDLIKAAVSAAQAEASQAAKEAMKELTGGMDLPGMDGLM